MDFRRDAGIDVGLPYKGSAPDMGYAEYDPGFTPPLTDADIISFALSQQTAPATINANNRTVSIEVAYGTNVTSLTPTISISAGATINPASGVTRNFSTSQTYVVTAEDASTQTWTVTVTVAGEEPELPLVKKILERNGSLIFNNGRIITIEIEE